jgi:sulfate permease, SulP family
VNEAGRAERVEEPERGRRDRVKDAVTRARARPLPRVEKSDLAAGLTSGIANIPDGMASAVLAGVNPVLGIYTVIVGTSVASLTISTQLMMFNTTSAMTLVAVDGLGSRTGSDRIEALIAVALVAGLVQIALGLLGLGMLTKFVPNSVMVGFLTGIASLVILGQLWDLTGYHNNLGGNKLEKTWRLFANLDQVDVWTTALGLGCLVTLVALSRGRLANFNLLIALALVTLVAWIFAPDSVVLVSSLGEIPRDLPSFDLPKFSLVPSMLLAGIAVGIVGVLQAAGVAQGYPNPDGSETSDSRDFVGQGIANTVCSCFHAMAGGGSLSGTALFVRAGARTRIAGIIQAVVVVILVLVFSDLLGFIPMAALAALLIYAAALSIRFPAIATIQRTSATSVVTMLATLLATLVIPLQQAVIVGVVFAAVLFVYRASVDVRVSELTIRGERLLFGPPPTQLRSNDVTVLDIQGNLFYAGARTLSRLLPPATGVERPVVVLRIRGQHDLGSTFFKVAGTYAQRIADCKGLLILAGVESVVLKRLERTGMTATIGADNVFEAGTVLGDSVLAAYTAGRAWLDSQQSASTAGATPG